MRKIIRLLLHHMYAHKQNQARILASLLDRVFVIKYILPPRRTTDVSHSDIYYK